MGLEPVEFIVALENALAISIPDDDAAAIRTPRALIQYLEARLPGVAANTPVAGVGLEQLVHRVLAETCEHERFTLDTDFRDIFR